MEQQTILAPPVHAIEIFARCRLFLLIAVWKALPVQPLYLSASEALPTATRTQGARLARLAGSSAKLGRVAESILPSRKRQLDRRWAPGPAPWLALLLAGAGLRNSLPASLGGMRAATVAAGRAQQPLLAFQELSAPKVLTFTTSSSPWNTSSVSEKQFSLPCVASSPSRFLCFPLKSRALCSRVALNYECLQYLLECNSTWYRLLKPVRLRENAGYKMASAFPDRFPVPVQDQGPDLRWSHASPHQLSAQPQIKHFCATHLTVTTVSSGPTTEYLLVGTRGKNRNISSQVNFCKVSR